ncbi:MAG TPA: hypothetical protein PLC36_10170 [Flavobacterium sp.]|nr:hypothetical protein [Flavobacterium sp.]HQX04253.1 hypothetical protein [Flavobacterium sp.]
MEEYILEKIATFSHLQGKINISNVPQHLLPNVGDTVNIVLSDLITHSNFINANGYRINNVLIGNWLEQNNIGIGGAFYIKITNNNTFEFLINV